MDLRGTIVSRERINQKINLNDVKGLHIQVLLLWLLLLHRPNFPKNGSWIELVLEMVWTSFLFLNKDSYWLHEYFSIWHE